MGWGGIKNGKLLTLAAADFDSFLTVDKNLPYQQNLAILPLAVVVLDAYSNELPVLLPLVQQLEQALSSLKLRSVSRLDRGHNPQLRQSGYGHRSCDRSLPRS